MIELLMVIIIIAVLGATAIPQFLDFRNEARAAALQQILAAMRVSIKNQEQQSRLRCGTTGDPTAPASIGFYNRLGLHINANDITYYNANATQKICSTSDVPNSDDRVFWIVPSNQKPVFIALPIVGVPVDIFTNPFVPVGGVVNSQPLIRSDQTTINSNGGICGLADSFRNLGIRVHWIYNNNTGQIFAGTNTPNINECNF